MSAEIIRDLSGLLEPLGKRSDEVEIEAAVPGPRSERPTAYCSLRRLAVDLEALMATKKGIVDRAMASKPVKAAKDVVNSAIDAFNDPPLAPDNIPAKSRKAVRQAARKPSKKSSKTRDRQLVSGMEDYEVKYLATKHSVTQKAVREIVAAVGKSRSKVEAEIKRRRG